MQTDKPTAATIELPGVDFNALARQVIAAKLSQALAVPESQAAIEKIVLAALQTKVNENGGTVSAAGYQNTIPFLEWLVQDMVRGVTKDVLKEKCAELRPALAKLIEGELKKSAKAAAIALTDSFIKTAQNGYNLNVTVGLAVIDKDRR